MLDSTRHSEYRSVVGMLLYISNTVRFDIAYHVSVLASYVNAPREIHYKAAERVLEYLGLLKLKICDQLSMLVKVYNNKNEYCSEIKIPDKTKVYLVVKHKLEVLFTVELQR